MKDFFFELMLDMDLLRAEWERKETAKRRDEGIASAKKRGVKFGRPLDVDMRAKFKELYPLTRDKDNENYRIVTSVCNEINCSRNHFYYMAKLLKENGWEYCRTKGSHYIYVKNGKALPVPKHNKDIGKELYNKIIKEARAK